VITGEILRRAIFNPAVRTRRISGRQAGLLIDAEDLQTALQGLVPDTLDADDIDAALRRHGGHRVERFLSQLARAALRQLTNGRWPQPARQQYWLDMYSWQKLRQRPC